ncbi:MAG: hypothetical protein AB7H97_15015 [Pseudobdellovibrionaceae bacterium]
MKVIFTSLLFFTVLTPLLQTQAFADSVEDIYKWALENKTPRDSQLPLANTEECIRGRDIKYNGPNDLYDPENVMVIASKEVKEACSAAFSTQNQNVKVFASRNVVVNKADFRQDNKENPELDGATLTWATDAADRVALENCRQYAKKNQIDAGKCRQLASFMPFQITSYTIARAGWPNSEYKGGYVTRSLAILEQ